MSDAPLTQRPRLAPHRIDRRRWLQAAAALAAAAAWPCRADSGDAAAFDTLEFDWADTRRQRPVPVRLYLPRAASARDPRPLVVFSHGIGGSRRGYSWFGQHLAAHGIASLHPQHVGSDRELWRAGLFEVAGRVQGALHESEAVARALDLRFVLDTVLGGEFGPRLDARRIVAAGHSYGANTTLLAAGARVVRDGRVVELGEPRLAAAILISAPPFYGEGDPKRILDGVTLPTLHVSATEDVIRIPGYWSEADDRVKVFEAVASPRKWLAMFRGGAHSMFTDRATPGGPVLNPQVKAATQALALAFLHRVFDGDELELAAWPRRHASLLARFDAVTA
jgi:dienelactone hydrolase